MRLAFSPIQLTRIGAAKFLLWITLLPDFHVAQRQDPHSGKCLDIQFCGISFLAIVDLNFCHIQYVDSGLLIINEMTCPAWWWLLYWAIALCLPLVLERKTPLVSSSAEVGLFSQVQFIKIVDPSPDVHLPTCISWWCFYLS